MDEQQINLFMSIVKKNKDVTYYGLESDTVDMLILLAKYNYREDFEYACKCISETPTPNESYRNILSHMLAYIDFEKKKKTNIFADIFNDHYINILHKYKKDQ